ncbi:CHC2 zinc finger family protein [Mycobacterium kansasii]|uniref:CHC2 zinc finger family protein n=1 Tax=Mycobacterium kansasii TaxID=1768 RepID=A0A1V3WZ20_MYCKA|nr:CHC2 zinc finger family protein [Mycobacterium kansasii]
MSSPAGRSRISDRDIAAIRDGARIEDVVGDYVQLRRAGADSLRGLCPFHNEKSPSFHVRPNHGHFHCFGCGEGGDVYAFIQKIEHVSFVEAVELLADRIGYTISYTGAATSVQRDRAVAADSSRPTRPRRSSMRLLWSPTRPHRPATT